MIRRPFVLPLVAVAVFGQNVMTRQPIISAKSGIIQYLEGDVFLNGRLLETKIGKFEDMKDGSTLKTTEGRAEVLLTPGSFLRIAESSSVKMHDARLSIFRAPSIGRSKALLQLEICAARQFRPALHAFRIFRHPHLHREWPRH